MNPKVHFVGAGNMAASIIRGLIAHGFEVANLTASDPSADNLERLAGELSIQTSTENGQFARSADVVVLAVKPQVLEAVCRDLLASLNHQPLIISIAAGIDVRSLELWLGDNLPIVRCMPNTPAQLSCGAAGLYGNHNTTAAQKEIATAILEAVGSVQWLSEESLLDAVTAVSGSGPAYYFLFMEAMIDAGVALGLDKECATELTLQTALGAAKLALASNDEVSELRRQVTSPNGTTERAINAFEEDKLRKIVAHAMTACAERSQELSRELGAPESQ